MWLKNEDKPGLAMSRSIGDHIARGIGVIWEPTIQIWEIKHPTSILVIGSDGIFEYMDHQDISKIIWKYKDESAEKIAFKIVDEAASRWKDQQQWCDDCTWVIVKLGEFKQAEE